MNDILINAFVARVKAEQMDIDKVPIPYREEVEKRLNVA